MHKWIHGLILAALVCLCAVAISCDGDGGDGGTPVPVPAESLSLEGTWTFWMANSSSFYCVTNGTSVIRGTIQFNSNNKVVAAFFDFAPSGLGERPKWPRNYDSVSMKATPLVISNGGAITSPSGVWWLTIEANTNSYPGYPEFAEIASFSLGRVEMSFSTINSITGIVHGYDFQLNNIIPFNNKGCLPAVGTSAQMHIALTRSN